MKKIIVLLIMSFILLGCDIVDDMDNTPTRRVESFLDAYQRLDSNVLNDLDNLIEDNRFTIEQRTAYKELMKDHYRNLRYEIRDETINGDRATVEVELEVTDFSRILSRQTNPNDYLDEEGNFSARIFYDVQIALMREATGTVTYTITFYLTRTDGTWVLDTPSEAIIQKIHGIFQY